MRLKNTVLALGWSMARAGLAATTAPADVAPSGAITVAMSSFKFDPTALTATSGTVGFFLQNVGAGTDVLAQQRHNLAIGVDQDHLLAKSDEVSAGEAVVFTVEGLAPGTYAIWCSVQGHAANGMVGTLTVSP
jgi:plastocyanin